MEGNLSNLFKLLYYFVIVGIFIVLSHAKDQTPSQGGATQTPGLTVTQASGLLDTLDNAEDDDNTDVTVPIVNSTGDEGLTKEPDYIGQCPSNINCDILGAECIACDIENVTSCVYGSQIRTTCTIKEGIQCSGPPVFSRQLTCRYCYQSPESDHYCTPPVGDSQCRVVSAPRERYKANCTAKSEVLCLGRREFYKMKTCDWTSGKRWSTALILSITVGGFGVDRFYLGLWKEGIGKLFSFGGLGAWTLVDVVLIATGYVGPADGSLYMF